MTEVYIGIGSNLGNKTENIVTAVDSLKSVLSSITMSDYYMTAPRDFINQDTFLNVVVRGYTSLTPDDLLLETQRIEKEGGRVREGAIPKGPRMIDLDILLYGNEVLASDSLSIPHKAIGERRFVLIPLLELDPGIKDPFAGDPYYLSVKKTGMQGVYCSSLKHYNNCFI